MNLRFCRRARIALAAIAPLLGSSQSFGRQEVSSPSAQADHRWIVQVDNAHGEKGRLPVKGTAVQSCLVENNGPSKAVLTKLSASCSCVAVQCEPPEIEPGEVATITLVAPVPAVSGRQEHYAVIEAKFRNADGIELKTEQFRISVAYEADLSFFCEPQRLLISAIQGVQTRRTVFVRSQSLEALKVRDFRVSVDGLRVDKVRRIPVPAPERLGEEALAIDLICLRNVPGIDSGALSFHTSDPTIPECSVPIEVSIKEALLSDPAGFALILTPGETERRQTVDLHARDGGAIGGTRCSLVNEDGSLYAADGIRVQMTHDDPSKIRIALTALPPRMAPEGILSVCLLDADGTVLRKVPVAWVKLEKSQKEPTRTISDR